MLNQEEMNAIKKYTNGLRNIFLKNNVYEDKNEIDLKIYKYILDNTSFPPKRFLEIFNCLPIIMQHNISKYLNYKNINEFKENFDNFYLDYIKNRNNNNYKKY